MESKIDWSKAPEGCIGAFTSKHDFRSVGFSSFFVITKRYSDYGAQAGCSGEDQDGKEYHVFEKYWDYHEKPALWSGEGMPPVGVVCMANGYEVVIVAHHCNGIHAIYAESEVDGLLYYGEPNEFRPIRTPEQIAADARRKAIDEMVKALGMDEPGTAEYIRCGLIYDAGFRKP